MKQSGFTEARILEILLAQDARKRKGRALTLAHSPRVHRRKPTDNRQLLQKIVNPLGDKIIQGARSPSGRRARRSGMQIPSGAPVLLFPSCRSPLPDFPRITFGGSK